MKFLKLVLVLISLNTFFARADMLPGGGGTGTRTAISCRVTSFMNDENKFEVIIESCEYPNGVAVSDFILKKIKAGLIEYQVVD